MSVQLISQREYARRRDVAPSAVARAVAEKRISLIDGKIDPEVADIQWERNTRARADSGHRTTPRRELNDTPPDAPPASAPAGAPAPSVPARHDSDYYADRARRERVDADLAELELLQKRGEVYSRQEVDALLERVLGRLRPALLQISARLAPVLAGESEQSAVAAILDAEMRAVLASSAGEG